MEQTAGPDHSLSPTQTKGWTPKLAHAGAGGLTVAQDRPPKTLQLVDQLPLRGVSASVDGQPGKRPLLTRDLPHLGMASPCQSFQKKPHVLLRRGRGGRAPEDHCGCHQAHALQA